VRKDFFRAAAAASRPTVRHARAAIGNRACGMARRRCVSALAAVESRALSAGRFLPRA
jgi:hypothetical protein